MENVLEPKKAELSMADVCRVMLEETRLTADERSLVCCLSFVATILMVAVIQCNSIAAGFCGSKVGNSGKND